MVQTTAIQYSIQKTFDFFLTPNLTSRLIQKITQNITYFVVAWFINKSFFQNDLNLTMFVQIFE
jgi:hypothetical protein